MKKRISRGTLTIKADGSPFQVGFTYGEKARDKILQNITRYRNILQLTTGYSWEKLNEMSKKGSEEIRSFNEKALQVMEGISQGAKIPLEDIITLNYRYELLFSQRSSCTSIGVQTENLSLVAQNWDLHKDIEDGIINLEFKVNNHPKVFTQVEAGSLAHRGLNSEGIALCINALKSKEDGHQLNVPLVSVLGWTVLNSSNLTRALEWIQESKRSSSINYLMARKELLVDIEITPKDFEYIEPSEHGLISHTNHFLCSRFKNLENNLSMCSWLRQLRVNHLTKKQEYKLDIEGVKSILKDHFDYPYSICRHTTNEQGINGASKTLASTIIDINRSEVHYTIGNPCLSEYKKIVILKKT